MYGRTLFYLMDDVWTTDPTLIHLIHLEHVTADKLVRTGLYFLFL